MGGVFAVFQTTMQALQRWAETGFFVRHNHNALD
jgi:hypothetical protein